MPGKAPGGNDEWSRGNSVGFVNLPAGMPGDTLIPTLERNGFVRVEDETFDVIVPGDKSHRSYVGFVVLRDTSAQQPNEFFLGVGPSDTLFYHEAHDGSIKSGKLWKDHIGTRVRLVQRLASSPQ